MRGESGAHAAPYVALLIRVSRARVGESPGAAHTAAPLEIELEPYKESLVREKRLRELLRKLLREL